MGPGTPQIPITPAQISEGRITKSKLFINHGTNLKTEPPISTIGTRILSAQLWLIQTVLS